MSKKGLVFRADRNWHLGIISRTNRHLFIRILSIIKPIPKRWKEERKEMTEMSSHISLWKKSQEKKNIRLMKKESKTRGNIIFRG